MALKEKIYRKIRDEIVIGKLMPGERLTEIQFSKKFGCSRGPVREALNQLANEGFIAINPNQGAVVNKISARVIEDYYSLLELLEGKAVEWSVAQLEQDDIDRLVEINGKLKNLSRDDKDFIKNWVSINGDFHRLFRDKCGNNAVNIVVDEIRLKITRSLYSSLVMTAFDEYLQDHDDIIDAVSQKDAGRARNLMASHISRGKNVLLNFLNKTPML
jgi:DNA-binding GntR family transcriptional regulator